MIRPRCSRVELPLAVYGLVVFARGDPQVRAVLSVVLASGHDDMLPNVERAGGYGPKNHF